MEVVLTGFRAKGLSKGGFACILFGHEISSARPPRFRRC
jgi:hypothetical protein